MVENVLTCVCFLRKHKIIFYDELLEMSRKSTVKMHNYWSLCIDVFKTLNDLNPSFMKETFYV